MSLLEFDAQDIERLSGLGTVRAIARRERLSFDGATLDFVVEGHFRIFRHAAFVRDVTLGLARRGDVLGAGAAFDAPTFGTGAEALIAGRILLISLEQWRATADARPGLYLKLARSLAARVRGFHQRFEQLSRTSVEGRVAASLVELGRQFGTSAANGILLDLSLSQQDLARLAGTTRESCSAAIAEFARCGYVDGGRLRGMVLRDLAALEAFAGAGPVRPRTAGAGARPRDFD